MKTLFETQTSYLFLDDQEMTFLRVPAEGDGNVAYDFIGELSKISHHRIVDGPHGQVLYVEFEDGRWYMSSPFKNPPCLLEEE